MHPSTPGIELGHVTVAPAAAAALALHPGNDPHGRGWLDLLARHAAGDWGDVDPGDQRANQRAVSAGLEVQSAYELPGDLTRIWIVTTGDRALTTILRPSEYPPARGRDRGSAVELDQSRRRDWERGA